MNVNYQEILSNSLQLPPVRLTCVVMKTIVCAISLLMLNSCNTLIGMGRDTKEGFYWCNGKIQNMRQNGGGGNDPGGTDGAPVY